jgi:hypothetical protein
MTISTTKPTDPAISAAINRMFPEPKALTLGEGLAVDIRVLNFGQIAKISRLLKPLLSDPSSAGDVRGALIDNLETMAACVAIAIDWPVERVLELAPEACVQLIAALLEANYRHFEQILPRFAEQFGIDMAALMPPVTAA